MSDILIRNANRKLEFVEDLSDYKIHHDDTDIRDFDVKLTSGEVVGEVEGLLADVAAKRIRYVEIEIEDDVINRHTLGHYSEDDRHVLIPIGLVTIDKTAQTVLINGIGFDHMVNYPRYRRDVGYTTAYELDTNNYLADFHEYGSTYNRETYDTNFYRKSDSIDDAFYTSKFYTGA